MRYEGTELALVVGVLVACAAVGCSSDRVRADADDDWSPADGEVLDGGSVDAPPDPGGDTRDGASDAPPGTDAPDGGRADAPDGYPRPNACSDDKQAYYNYASNITGIKVPKIPWRIVEHGGIVPPATFEGTYRGTTTVDPAVAFRCPPTAGELGLDCSTETVLVVEPNGQGSGGDVKLAVSIPLETIELPAEGTTVEVSYRARGKTYPEIEEAHLAMRETSSGRYVLALRRALANSDGEPWRFHEQDWPASVSMTDDPTDPSTAYCIAENPCPRYYRIEPLIVQADGSQRVDPGTTAEFANSGEDYRFWHLLSFMRDGPVEGWPHGGCADGWHPTASVAFTRRK